MLLALAVSSIESIQAFIFYIVQYSISNLNIFIILIAIGYSFYSYINDSIEKDNLVDRNNSPIQLVSQLKGFFYINPFLAISLAVTIFSFVGVPPLIGFFGKQMVLSAALDKGYVFIVLIAVFTSVIGGVYYLNIVKETFFYEPSSIINPLLKESKISASVQNQNKSTGQNIYVDYNNVILSSPIAFTISVITLIILLFIFINNE
jgi:NADH-ubiquinone oxidoreductase chain 2